MELGGELNDLVIGAVFDCKECIYVGANNLFRERPSTFGRAKIWAKCPHYCDRLWLEDVCLRERLDRARPRITRLVLASCHTLIDVICARKGEIYGGTAKRSNKQRLHSGIP